MLGREGERERASSKREKVLGQERTGQGREISRERKRERGRGERGKEDDAGLGV